MSLISSLNHLFHIKPPTPAVHAHPNRSHRAQPVAKGDGFDVAAPPKVNLGTPPPASSADDADYVTGLYHELLHREPDPAGFVSHVRGLQAGMSRDEIRNVFLTSPEFRGLQGGTPATPAAPVDPSAPATPAAPPAPAAPANYANIPGFNLDKIKDETHKNDKYSPALRVFSAAIGTLGLAPGSQSLPAIADYAHQHGFPDARVAGKDLLDFGDGKGPIDVITDVGGPNQNWWFHNQEGDGSPVNRPGTGLPDTSRPGTTTTTTPVPGPAAGSPAASDATRLGPVPLEGFDGRKLADPNHKTVKYLFGRVATHYPLDSVKDKAGAEALLNKMVPDLRAAGLDIQGVKGDRLLMKTPLGMESIDVVRGAGSGNPGWWWGADGTVASPEEIAKFPPLATSPTPTVPGPTGTPGEPGAPLTSVPQKPEYATAPIDKSSPNAAVLSAAKWARATYPDLFRQAAVNDQSGRNACMEIMTKVIGAMRAAGYDATRVVNHPDRAMTDGYRYGSDALALNGRVFDCYGDMGGASTPAANDVGEYTSDRLRE